MEKSTHTTEYRILRAELRSARESANLSQRDLATLLKVPHSWVAKVETGERRIDVVEFGWFLAACGVDAAEVSTRLFRHMGHAHPSRSSKAGRTK